MSFKLYFAGLYKPKSNISSQNWMLLGSKLISVLFGNHSMIQSQTHDSINLNALKKLFVFISNQPSIFCKINKATVIPELKKDL